jgi:hypothetical protein
MEEFIIKNTIAISAFVGILAGFLRFHPTIKNIVNYNQRRYEKLKFQLENKYLDEDIKEIIEVKIRRLSFIMSSHVSIMNNKFEHIKELYKKIHAMDVGIRTEKTIFSMISFEKDIVKVKKVWNGSNITLLLFHAIVSLFTLFISVLIINEMITSNKPLSPDIPISALFLLCFIIIFFYVKLDDLRQTHKLKIRIENKRIEDIK